MTMMQTKTSPLFEAPLNFATKEKLNKMLSRTKGQLFAMPGAAYLGSLLCNHRFVWDLDCDTAWCNGTTIGWNPNFFVSLSPLARVFVLAHELWHTGYGHMIRRGNRCPRIWNYAADYVINNRLDTQGFCLDVGFQVFMDHQYDRLTTEQVYDRLVAEGMIPFDTTAVAGPGLDGDVRELPGKEGKQQTIQVQTTMVQAIEAAKKSNQHGDLPGEISFHINQFLNPKLDWRRLLRKYFTALSADDYSWRRPSRRYEEYLPSLIGNNGLEHLIYYLDVSGSISKKEIVRFNSEVRAIHKNLKPELLTLVTFDTSIQDVYQFTKDQPFNEITVRGRGGTCLKCVHDHIVEHRPTAAVVFSDMHVRPMADDPGSPLLWVVMDNPKAQVPFGKMIHLDREDLAT